MAISNDTLQQFLMFQTTGQASGSLIGDLTATMTAMIRSRLRKRLVKGRFGLDDENAVNEATQTVLVSLCELHKKDPARHFDPTRGNGGADALKAFLFGFVNNAVKRYCDQWHNAKHRRKVIAESALEFNEREECDSILKSAVAKPAFSDSELAAIMNDCLAELPKEKYRTVLRLHNWEGLSERKIAPRMGVSVSKAHRTLVKARKLMKASLHRRGIDESWFTEAA